MPARITEQTRREIVRLLELRQHTFEEIAVMTGVTQGSVGREAYAKGIKPPRRGPKKGEGGRPKGTFGPNHERVLALKAQGKGATAIAKELEISRARVYQILADTDGTSR